MLMHPRPGKLGYLYANIASFFQITIIQQLKKAGFLKSALSLNQC